MRAPVFKIILCQNTSCGRHLELPVHPGKEVLCTCPACGESFFHIFSAESAGYDAYLDIETTGLSPCKSDLTVIGIYVDQGAEGNVIQLVGDTISPAHLMEALNGVKSLYTYNGKQFDLPFIKTKTGVDLARLFQHRDLMYDCWKNNLYGGLKKVERTLGIHRELTEINGLVAVRLWYDYLKGSKMALDTLLKYNEEDVINLKILRQKLGVRC